MTRVFGWSFRRLWQEVCAKFGRKPAAPEWIVYVLDGHAPSAYYHKLFRKAGHAVLTITVTNDEEIPRDGVDRPVPFLYIGHGTRFGVFSSTGFAEGLRSLLCDTRQADGFVGSPHIWWSCFSAQWLRRSTRVDWFGYAGLLGVDTRGSQEKWWTDQLVRVIDTITDAVQSKKPASEIRSAVELMHENARKQYYSGRQISWTSVLCARLIAGGVDWHPEFGMRR